MSAAPTLATRNFITPITATLFLVSTITGIMLLLHWQSGLVRASHEWLSLVFSAIAIWHIINNWRSFIRYFSRRLPLAAFAVTILISLVFTGMTSRGPSNVSPRAVFTTLSNATLENAGPAFGLTSDQAIAKLQAAGLDAIPSQTLNEIGQAADSNGAEVMTLLAR